MQKRYFLILITLIIFILLGSAIFFKFNPRDKNKIEQDSIPAVEQPIQPTTDNNKPIPARTSPPVN